LSSGSDLRDCDLNRQILTKRDLSGSDLREAILDGADLGGACLRDALLVQTSLRGVTLKDATLCGANLSRADLSGARVLASQLECALICSTTMPDGSRGDDNNCGGWGAHCAEGMVCCNCTCVPVGSDRHGVCPTITSVRLIRRR
jgi:uncharacterized protein YjbI with pentapeptide repeats